MNWNHVLHLLRRDFRSQRFHLILWVILLAIYVAILGHEDLERPSGASVVAILANLLPGVIMVYGLVIAVVLIHQDPVAGTSAFWLTRPIRGLNLFLAKAIEVAAMVALWFLADFLVLIGNSAASYAGYIAFDSAVSLLPLMLAAFAIAAMVTNTARFLLAIALSIVGIGLLAMILNLTREWFFIPDPATDAPRSLAERLSAQVVAASIASLGALAILVWQFITRRTGVSVAAALLVAAAAIVTMTAWSRDFMTPRQPAVDHTNQFDAVRVEIDPSQLSSGTLTASVGDSDPIEYRTVSAPTSVLGLPDGVFTDWGAARTRVVVAASGQEFPQHGGNAYARVSPEAISAALDGATLRGAAILRGGEPEASRRNIVQIGAEEFEKFAHQPCTLQSEIQLKLFRYDLIGELPLEEGATLRHDGLQVQITNVSKRPIQQTMSTTDESQSPPDPSYECEVSFTEKYPNSKSKAVREGNSKRNPYSDLIYILLNRETGDAVLSNGGGSSSFDGLRMMFHSSDRSLDFQPYFTGNAHERLPKMDEAWLAGATLVILNRAPLGEITRTAILEEVVFAPQEQRPHPPLRVN